MILFQNSILVLDYNPATDILEVAYPDLQGYFLPEIKHSFEILVETVKNYDVKKVLLDSTHTVISVSAAESRAVTCHLAAGMLQTRVQRLARVQSASTAVEMIAQENISHIQATTPLPFQLQTFTHKADAIAWLKGNQ